MSLLPRVCPEVPLEVGAAVRAVETLLAPVQLVEGVQRDVPREVVNCAEGPWAYRTHQPPAPQRRHRPLHRLGERQTVRLCWGGRLRGGYTGGRTHWGTGTLAHCGSLRIEVLAVSEDGGLGS